MSAEGADVTGWCETIANAVRQDSSSWQQEEKRLGKRSLEVCWERR